MSSARAVVHRSPVDAHNQALEDACPKIRLGGQPTARPTVTYLELSPQRPADALKGARGDADAILAGRKPLDALPR